MPIERVYRETLISLPPVLERLDVDVFWDYLEWQDSRQQLPEYISNPFKKSLGAATGFTDETPPKELTERPITIGSVVFNVQSEKTTKTPRYADIYKEFEAFLRNLQDSYDKGMLKKGYRTVQAGDEKLVYIQLDIFLGKLQGDVTTMLSEKEGVKHSVGVVKPEELISYVPQSVTIVSGTDYSALTEYNARMFQEATNLKEKGDINTGFERKKDVPLRFKKLLLKDSFARLGETPVTGQPVKLPYPYGDVTFVHSIKAEGTVKYEGIIDGFLKPLPQTLRRGVTAGDFIVASSLKTEGLPEMLKAKGIWGDEFQAAYSPRIIDGEVYVLLGGPLQRLESFKRKKTTKSYNQHVDVKRTR